MGCKNCEALRMSVRNLEETVWQKKERVDMLRKTLEWEQAKPSVEELLKTASAAAQIAVLVRKSLPVSAVSDEASSVALTALKQARERLNEKEGA